MIWNRTALKIFFACFYDSIILKVLFSHKKPIILLLQVSKFWKTHPPSPAAHCSFMIDISPFCSPFFLYYKKSKNQKSITHFYFWYLSCLLWKTLFSSFSVFQKHYFSIVPFSSCLFSITLLFSQSCFYFSELLFRKNKNPRYLKTSLRVFFINKTKMNFILF